MSSRSLAQPQATSHSTWTAPIQHSCTGCLLRSHCNVVHGSCTAARGFRKLPLWSSRSLTHYGALPSGRTVHRRTARQRQDISLSIESSLDQSKTSNCEDLANRLVEPLPGPLKGKQGEPTLSTKGQSNTVGQGQETGRPRRHRYVCVCMHGFSCALLVD